MNKTINPAAVQLCGSILVIDDDPLTLKNLRRLLEGAGHTVSTFINPLKALERLEKSTFDLIISDVRMPGMDGFSLMQKAKSIAKDVEVILITGFASLDDAVDATKQGSYHYLAKPFAPEQVRTLVQEALMERSLRKGIQPSEPGVKSPEMIGMSPKMMRVRDIIRQIAPTECNVLITGESGTGKELAARSIHGFSNRSQGLFVAFNCAAFSEGLVDNELFGHEKEAFTGAASLKKGLIETANGGTLFLDEVADMPLSMQSKLLRVIQERELIRVGGTRPTSLDVRIVAATSKDLKKAVTEGLFRQDLYYRLNVVNILLPPLMHRKEDIPLLIYHILDKFNDRFKNRATKKIKSVSGQVMSILENYVFPGNVRELENILERAMAICTGDSIQAGDLPSDLLEINLFAYNRSENSTLTLEDVEKDYISHVLKIARGSRRRAAEILGIERTSLWRKMKKYGLK